MAWNLASLCTKYAFVASKFGQKTSDTSWINYCEKNTAALSGTKSMLDLKDSYQIMLPLQVGKRF